jgi:hypothetical protein
MSRLTSTNAERVCAEMCQRGIRGNYRIAMDLFTGRVRAA